MYISCAKLNFRTDIDSIQKQCKSLEQNPAWLPHYNTNEYQGKWEVLALRSPGGDSKQVYAELHEQKEFKNTPLLYLLPAVEDLINSFQCEIMSVRLLNLRAGAVIKQHRDLELCFEKGEARIHFPIFTNPMVEFFVNDERLEMNAGECWYINANLPHRVSNHGDTDRIHLVIDCVVNEWLTRLFDQSEKSLYEDRSDETDLLKIVSELRLQNTETSNKLADDILAGLNKEVPG